MNTYNKVVFMLLVAIALCGTASAETLYVSESGGGRGDIQTNIEYGDWWQNMWHSIAMITPSHHGIYVAEYIQFTTFDDMTDLKVSGQKTTFSHVEPVHMAVVAPSLGQQVTCKLYKDGVLYHEWDSFEARAWYDFFWFHVWYDYLPEGNYEFRYYSDFSTSPQMWKAFTVERVVDVGKFVCYDANWNLKSCPPMQLTLTSIGIHNGMPVYSGTTRYVQFRWWNYLTTTKVEFTPVLVINGVDYIASRTEICGENTACAVGIPFAFTQSGDYTITAKPGIDDMSPLTIRVIDLPAPTPCSGLTNCGPDYPRTNLYECCDNKVYACNPITPEWVLISECGPNEECRCDSERCWCEATAAQIDDTLDTITLDKSTYHPGDLLNATATGFNSGGTTWSGAVVFTLTDPSGTVADTTETSVTVPPSTEKTVSVQSVLPLTAEIGVWAIQSQWIDDAGTVHALSITTTGESEGDNQPRIIVAVIGVFVVLYLWRRRGD